VVRMVYVRNTCPVVLSFHFSHRPAKANMPSLQCPLKFPCSFRRHQASPSSFESQNENVRRRKSVLHPDVLPYSSCLSLCPAAVMR
jgi:hypothetical protein